MSTHVSIIKFINEVGKLWVSLFHDGFNKLNNTGTQLLDSFYQIPFKITLKLRLLSKITRFCHIHTTLLYPSLHNVTKNHNPY